MMKKKDKAAKAEKIVKAPKKAGSDKAVKSEKPAKAVKASKKAEGAAAKRVKALPERVSMKPGSYLAPLPVTMISCAGKEGRPNIMTVAWNGTINSDPPMLSVSIRKDRYSHALISETREFVLNVPDRRLAKATDYCGVKSFREVDKFAELKLTAEPMDELRYAPAIAEAPLSLACKVTQILELPSHDLFLAEITGVRVRRDLLDEKGALRLEDAELITYVHGQYHKVGSWLGFFGWSLAKPEVYQRRRKERGAARGKSKKR